MKTIATTTLLLQLFSIIITSATTTVVMATSSSSETTCTSVRKVLVTGAGGKTGRLVMKKLLERPASFEPFGVVRTSKSKEALIKDEGIPESQLIVADICDADSISNACEKMDAIIICTSATPAPTGEKTLEGRPVFGFPNGQPEKVDWIGQKNQIDGAQQHGVKHVVLCSSMGGTEPDSYLNKLGQNPDGSGGNILLWKRKSEKYLIDSGLKYTIVHPGGLVDDKGGLREIVVGVDDIKDGTDNRNIPREDVAELLVESLLHDSYSNRSFDARTKPEGEGTPTTDYNKLLLMDMKDNCNYSLGKTP